MMASAEIVKREVPALLIFFGVAIVAAWRREIAIQSEGREVGDK